MKIRVVRQDVHLEQCGSSVVPVTHRFESNPPATQAVGFVDGAPLLLQGDRFANEAAPDHRQPKCGRFAQTPSGEGELTAAGQSLLQIDGRSVMTLDGRLETCSDGVPEASCREATVTQSSAVLFVNGVPGLCGR